MRDPFDRNRNYNNKIVYYLGAGASANAIPMVSEMPIALKKFEYFLNIQFLEKKERITSLNNDDIYKLIEFKEFCLGYIPIIKSSPSLDTFAKKLWDENQTQEYRKYKIFICILFNFFHFFDTKKHPDYAMPNKLEGRYENFIRSINVPSSSQASNKRIIPANFSFLTWNYDFQLESTLSRFDSLDSTKNIIKSEFASSYAKIANINGTSLIFQEIPYKDKIEENEIFDFLVNIYKKLLNEESENKLKFSWEYEYGFDFNINISETNYVVIIGYSFPTFNREIDLMFFSNLKKDKEFENENDRVKVYTQGYDFNDSVRIKRYLEQIFPENKAPFEIIPVESPFFYVPAGYWT